MAKAKQTKTRTVMVTLELEANTKLKRLRDRFAWQARLDDDPFTIGETLTVRQVTATVQQSVRVK